MRERVKSCVQFLTARSFCRIDRGIRHSFLLIV